MTPKTLLARDPALLTESQWASIVNETAALGGWRRYHTYLSKRSPAGFPDLVLLRPPRLIFVELKRDAKESKTTPEQDAWLDDLRELGEAIARATTVVTVHSEGESQVMDLLMKNPEVRQKIARELQAPGVEVYVWRPSDWPEVVEVLTGKRPREAAA